MIINLLSCRKWTVARLVVLGGSPIGRAKQLLLSRPPIRRYEIGLTRGGDFYQRPHWPREYQCQTLVIYAPQQLARNLCRRHG